MITYIASQFKLRSVRALTVIAGIAIGTMLFITLTILGDGFKEAARKPLEGVSADLIATKPLSGTEIGLGAESGAKGIRQPFGMTYFTDGEIESLRFAEGIQYVSESLQLWDFEGSNYRTIQGVTPGEAIVGPGVALNGNIQTGRTFRDEESQVVVLDKHFAAFYSYKLDDEIKIGNTPFKVIGIVEMPDANQTAASNMYIPIEDAKQIAGTTQTNQVYIKVASAGDVEAVSKRLSEQMESISLISEDSLVQVMGGIGKVSTRFAGAAGIVGLLGGFLLGWFALSGLLAERRKELGLMRALGWSKREVTKAFLLETAALGILGGIAGILLGLLAAWGMGQIPIPELDLGTTVSGHQHGLETAAPKNTDTTLPLEISAIHMVVSLLSAMISGMLACLMHLRRELGLKPMNLLKS